MEEKEVEICLDKHTFEVVNEDGDAMIDGKEYELFVGFGQPDRKTAELLGMESLRLDITLG